MTDKDCALAKYLAGLLRLAVVAEAEEQRCVYWAEFWRMVEVFRLDSTRK